MNSDDDHLSSLIAKYKSATDIDGKLDVVAKLEEEFQTGTEIHDAEGLTSVLKACLRTSNQHLSTATLSAIASFVPLLSTPPSPSASFSSISTTTADNYHALRQALSAFLPSGGIFERLGDNREKAREKAKEALISIGSVVFKANLPQAPSLRGKVPKGPETPLQLFERYMREQGLLSKSWRVKEQSLLSLVQLRRAHSQFPLRSFLPALVDALEDSDGVVRDCAKQSVIEIFTGSGVSDAARTDLKKEMAKKNVRKTIVDSVLSKILSGMNSDTPSTDPQDTKEEPTVSGFVPSRGQLPAISRNVKQAHPPEPERSGSGAGEGEAEVVPFYVASSRDLDNEFGQMAPAFEGRETEHNWLDREKAVMKIRRMLKGEVYIRYPDSFMSGLKSGILEGTLKALASLRTTVAANTCYLYSELAIALGSLLDPFSELLLTHLLKMAGFTKKIIANLSQNVVDAIIEHTSCHPRQTLPTLWNALQEKNVQARSFAVAHIKTFIECHGLPYKQAIESAGGVDILERSIKKGLADANPAVKEKARGLFWSFEAIWKENALAILGALDATARKQLQNASPVPLMDLEIPKSVTPNAKKSSIAAAIAASRAKAKQIATAPPTLRHQATSTSHAQHAQAVRAVSPPVHNTRKLASSIVTPSASSPPRSVTPPSPTPRVSLTRSGTKSLVVHERQRTVSSASSVSSPPPSPTAHRRRVSSSVVTQSIDHVVSQHNLFGHSSVPSSPPVVVPSSSQPANMGSLLDSIRSLSAYDNLLDGSEESMLIETNIPLPTDSDIGDDDSVNLINFSAPWETSKPASRSAASSSPTPSTPRVSNIPRSVVEDALRARAAQAESAAEQLLELVEPDDDNHLSPIPLSLLRTNGAAPKLSSSRSLAPPVTPINQTSTIMRQAALFQDSPVYEAKSPSLFDIIRERKHQTGWWLKRMSIINQNVPLCHNFSQIVQELEECRQSLENDSADLDILKKTIHLCLCDRIPTQNATTHPGSPLSRQPISSDKLSMGSPSSRVFDEETALLGDIWDNGKRSGALFKSLCTFMKPEKDRLLLEHGLFVLWELLPHLDGHDADILGLLLRLRYAQDFNVDEGTLTIRDAQVELMNERSYSLYGLSTMDICLKSFLSQTIPPTASEDAKIRAYAFGLITMAKFIIKLPADILEEEIPKIKQTLIEAYLNAEAMVRQAATTAITAAQVILQDESHLFALLEPLPDDKKNLLTYFFEKNNARDFTEQGHQSSSGSGMEKLSKEMDRLDQRLSTPPRPRARLTSS